VRIISNAYYIAFVEFLCHSYNYVGKNPVNKSHVIMTETYGAKNPWTGMLSR